MPRVELVYVDGCPHVGAAREALLRAFAESKMVPRWQEHRTDDEASPARVRGLGSPTVLVDGEDVVERSPAREGPSCRLYPAADGTLRGAPDAATIARALTRAAERENGGTAMSGCASRDLAERRARWVVWGVPFAAFVAGALVAHDELRAWLWTASFTVGGVACIVNAAASCRTHCFLTGPLFLLAALTSVLEATHLIAVGWPAIGIGTAVGTALAFGVERARGRYAGGTRTQI
jgi:hypothetical protein